MATCEGCGGSIRWLVNESTGSKAPIDPGPDPGGNVLVFPNDKYRVMSKAEKTAREAETAAWGAPIVDTDAIQTTSHFATCPKAEHFKRCAKCHRHPCECNR